MMSASAESLKRRARRWARRLKANGLDARVIQGQSAAGGGSLPGETLPTWLVAIAAPSLNELAKRLRTGEPSVVARIERDLLCFDPRTVLPAQENALIEAILSACQAD
jgi:L-seryl-tRNA(Ser) seleniumtransferase